MRPRRSFSSTVAAESRRRMRNPASSAEFLRWQAIWLAAGEDRPISYKCFKTLNAVRETLCHGLRELHHLSLIHI